MGPYRRQEVIDLRSSVLHDFITTNRTLLIDRCRSMVATRSGPKLPCPELAHGIPIFLDQVTKALAIEQSNPLAVKGTPGESFSFT